MNYVYGLGLISQSEERFRETKRHDERKEKSFEFFYHFDGLGSVMNLTDNKGKEKKQYRYDVWGNPRNGEGDDDMDDDEGEGKRSDPPDRFRFTGEELDGATGLYYLRARWYDPSVGRFINKDPLRGFGLSPRTFNNYVYTLNNPANFIDPTGLILWKQTIIGGLRAIGGIAEVGTGVALIIASPLSLGASAAVGTALIAHGGFNTGAGLTETVSGIADKQVDIDSPLGIVAHAVTSDERVIGIANMVDTIAFMSIGGPTTVPQVITNLKILGGVGKIADLLDQIITPTPASGSTLPLPQGKVGKISGVSK